MRCCFGSVGPGKRAQVSMEFLLVIAITFLFTIPLIVLFTRESQDAGEQVSMAQAAQIARRVVGSAESVYAFGAPTSVVLKVYMPPGVNSSRISSNELTFIVQSNGNLVEVDEVASMNLTGSLNVNPGIHNIRVTAMSNGVNISDYSG